MQTNAPTDYVLVLFVFWEKPSIFMFSFCYSWGLLRLRQYIFTTNSSIESNYSNPRNLDIPITNQTTSFTTVTRELYYFGFNFSSSCPPVRAQMQVTEKINTCQSCNFWSIFQQQQQHVDDTLKDTRYQTARAYVGVCIKLKSPRRPQVSCELR